ncbi:MAG: BMP family protein [Halobacteriaceae archaeon]
MSRKYLTRRDVAKGLGTAGLIGLAGCSTGDSGDSGDGGDNTTTSGGGTTTGGGGSDFRVGMVYTSAGLGDEGFNDSAQDGLQRAVEDFGIQLQEAEPSDSSQYSTFLRQYASGDYDLVCGLSFEMNTAMQQVASDFPDQPFTIVDTAVDLENVASYLFREHEGCYLVGKAAGLLTQQEFSAGAGKTNTTTSVGFLGGKRNPVIEKFHAGYEAGIKSFETSIDFKTAYAGSWTQPSKGKSIAESMYNDGVDIVFPAAGGTGLGVFQAAQEDGRFAFGVDKPQSVATPKYADVILGSMVKRVGNMFYRSVENTMNGNHRGGQTQTFGVEREGVNLVWGEELGDDIPQDVKDAVSQARQGIINGDISVPSQTYDN